MIKTLSDAAEFDRKDLLHLRFCLWGRPFVRPGRHAFQYLQRLLVPGQSVHVEHPGCDLVNRIERSPDPLPFLEPIPPCCGKSAKILAAQLLLTFSHLGYHVIALGFGLLVSHRRELGARAKEVAAEMTAQLARSFTVFRLLPTSQRFRRAHRQSSVCAERVKEAICLQSCHIATVPLLRIEVHIVRQQSNPAHWKRLYPRRNVLANEFERPECRRFGHKRSLERSGSRACRGAIP